MRTAATLPVRGVIFLDQKSRAKCAVEGVLAGIDNDSRMSEPDYQISGLRLSDPTKLIGTDIEVAGGHVRVWESCLLVNCVHQV
jgi:hypothetical protein